MRAKNVPTVALSLLLCVFVLGGCSGSSDGDTSHDAGTVDSRAADATPNPGISPAVSASGDSDVTDAPDASGTDASPAPDVPPASSKTCITAGHDEVVCAESCILEGQVYIEDERDLARVGKLGCDVIDGSLLIRGTQLTHLDGLDNIRVVTNWVLLEDNDRLVDLAGLRNLERFESLNIWDNARLRSLDQLQSIVAKPGFIGTDIRIRNNASLESIGGLSSVERALFLWLEDNPALADLSGLSSLRSAGWIKIRGSKKLADLRGLENLESVYNPCRSINGGGFSISGNTNLTSLDGLENLSRVSHGLGISSNPSLTDISALSGLSDASGCPSRVGVTIANNDALTTLEGLSVSSSVSISGNDALTDIDELSSLTEADKVTIRDNDLLADIEALSNLRSARYVSISHNDALTDIDGLRNLESVGYYYSVGNRSSAGGLYITGNDKLTDLDGLRSLGAAEDHQGDISIKGNPALTDISGLSNLQSAGKLVLEKNHALVTLDGLENLRRLSRKSLVLEDNAAIEDAASLLGVESLPGLRVVDNPRLPACIAQSIANAVEAGGDVEISGNDDAASCR